MLEKLYSESEGREEMTRAAKIERRIHPRVDHELPIRVAANGYDFTTSTDNVSCVGAYCTINKYVPPFTKVMIKLTLPIQEEANKEKRTVECKGVIVRTDDQDKGGFNIAIFFNEIAEGQKKKIAKYINQLLPN